MARIRHKRTLVERTVPDRAVPFFPDFEVVTDEPKADESKPARGRKPAVESDTTTEE